MSTLYEYCPLVQQKKEIRLFRLRSITPATQEREAEIIGSIENASLLDDPRYFALSYVWGEPVLSSKILLDDGTYITIAKNLLVALLHVARVEHLASDEANTSHDAERYDVAAISMGIEALSTVEHSSDFNMLLWIDAVCINQLDDIEKSWQVAQMADVFSHAERTLIFLGPETELSNEAVSLFQHIGEAAMGYGDISNRETLDTHIWNVTAMFVREDVMLDDLQGIDALIASTIRIGGDRLSLLIKAIMGCAWWSRTWLRTLQEFVLSLAPTFVMGHKTLHNDHVLTALLLLLRLQVITGSTSHKTCQKIGLVELTLSDDAAGLTYPGVELYRKRHMRELSWKPSFLEVFTATLTTGYNFEATDPRDFVYGLLGLVETWPPGEQRIEPNYSIQCSAVYTQATLALLQHGWVKVIRFAVSPNRRNDLPSWVFHFSNRVDPIIPANLPGTFPKALSYERNGDGKHLLTSEGITYGTIHCVGLRRVIRPGEDERRSVNRLITASDRTLIHTYFSGIVELLRPFFDTDEEFRYQLYLLVAAVMLMVEHGYMNEEFSFVLPSYLGENRHPPNYSTWTLALFIRDLIMEPTIMDATSLYDLAILSYESVRDLAWFERHEKCEEPTPLYYNDNYVTLRILSKAWISFTTRLTEREPFFVEGLCVGSALKAIRDGDVLAKLDIDPSTLYIVRPVDDDLWELVSMACVPRFWSKDAFPEGERTVFRFC